MSQDLARRAVACKGWRWLPGMRWTLPGTHLAGRFRNMLLDPEAVPDLTDPATLGCLLALVREAWGDPLMQVMNAGGGWVGFRPAPIWTDKEGCYETEAEALVAALEAAP